MARSPARNAIGAAWVASCVLAGAGCADRTPSASPPPEDIPALEASAEPAAATGPSATAPVAPEPPASPPPPPEEPGDRVYAKARFVWINPDPRPTQGWIGYLGLGGSVRVKGGDAEAAKVGGGGCDQWIAVEPIGYVCLGRDATLDRNDPAYQALLVDAPNLASPWPYRYAESIGTPRYDAPPTPEQQRRSEWDLELHRERLARAAAAKSPAEVAAIDEWLVGVDPSLTDTPLPELFPFGPPVRTAQLSVARGSTVAYTRSFDHAGRAFLLTADHALVPKDRIRPYAESPFAGVELGADVQLPLAFFRAKPRPKLRRASGGDDRFEATGAEWPRHGWVMLTGRDVVVGSDRYHETRDDGLWVRDTDASIIREAESIPYTEIEREKAKRDGNPMKWVDIGINAGTFVAYEESRPVFATLISPGRGGVPVPGIDPLKTASTPVGTFRVDGKFRTATMVSSSDSSIVHAEVQYVQNFHGPHALHGAYWHDAWGEKKSGGCVNLSPLDSMRMFDWTEPQVPPGWHGVRTVPEIGRATRVAVHP